MELTISSFYSEMGVDFKVSYKVDLFIREKLIENIMRPYGLDKKEPRLTLNLNVTTSKQTVKAEVKGPVYDNKNNFVSYGLWLPFKKITESKDMVATYIAFFFQLIPDIFQNYAVEPKSIKAVQKMVENEIIGNPSYTYDDEEIPPPDLSDILGNK